MKVLIIGPSGSGKTYLTQELKKLGLNVVDADSIEGLHSWYDRGGKKVEFPENAGKDFLENHSFLWDRNFLINYLKENPDIYIFGLSGNIFEVIDLFDKVYYLDVPPQVIQERLQYEDRKHPMGKTAYQRKLIVEYTEQVKEKARSLGLTFLDGTLTPKEIYLKVE
jgi:adenylate kinase family enzyme